MTATEGCPEDPQGWKIRVELACHLVTGQRPCQHRADSYSVPFVNAHVNTKELRGLFSL